MLSGLPWWLRWLRICLQCRRPGLDPLVGKIPSGRAWQPAPVFLPGESPWTEEPGGLQSMRLQRVGHDWVTFTLTFHDQWKNEWVHVLCHYKYYKHSSISTPSFVLGLGQLPFSLCFMRNYKRFSYFADFFSGYCLWSPHCWTFLLFHRENRGHQKLLLQLSLLSFLLHQSLSFFSFPFSEKWCHSCYLRKLPSLCSCLVWSFSRICTYW